MKPVCPIAPVDIKEPHDEVGRIVSHPRARELDGTRHSVANVRHERRRPEVRRLTKRPQHEPREGTDVAGRPEEPRVTSHATERARVLVVHLAVDDTFANGVVLGGRDAREKRCRRSEGGGSVPRAPELVELIVERPAPGGLDHESEHQEADIGVDRRHAGRPLQRNGTKRGLVLAPPGGEFPQPQVSRKPGGVFEQVANGNLRPIGGGPVLQQRADLRVEAEPFLSDGSHRERRGRHDFRQRREIEDGVEASRTRRGVVRETSKRLAPDGGVGATRPR